MSTYLGNQGHIGRNKFILCVCVCVCVCVYIYIYIVVIFWLHHVELPRRGIKPLLPAVKARNLSHWTTGEVYHVLILKSGIDIPE